MSRTKPTILSSRIKDWKAIEVLVPQGVFCLSYDGEPVSVRYRNMLRDGFVKYPRCAYTQAGHCYGLARRLNRLFKSSSFGVLYFAGSGEILSEEAYRERFGVCDRNPDPTGE